MDKSLINHDVLWDHILHNTPFTQTHAIPGVPNHLGAGMLYYAVTYTIRARLCVCLGSGGGFVPKLMRQAQRDAGIADDSETVLVDADMPSAGWGQPNYMDKPECYFRKNFDVRIICELTTDAACRFDLASIHYLHIDADHSYSGAKLDFCDWSPLVNDDGIITMHDTSYRKAGVSRVLGEIVADGAWAVVDFPKIGMGTAILKRA